MRLAHNRSGANLVSGVASALLAAREAELGLFEVDEAALPEVARRLQPRAVSLGNLFRDQLDRYGELELLAERWRATVQELPAEAALVVNGDDPQVGDLASERPGLHGFRARRPAARLGGAPARRGLEMVRPLWHALRLRGGIHRPPRGLPLPGLRPRTPSSSRARARDRAARPRQRLVRPCDARGHEPRRARRARPLQRLQRARGGCAGPRARRLSGGGSCWFAGLFCGVRPFRAHRDRRALAARAADQESGGSERGRPNAPDRDAGPGSCSWP